MQLGTVATAPVHGASVIVGLSLLQGNGFAFDSNPAYTLRLLHRENYITLTSE